MGMDPGNNSDDVCIWFSDIDRIGSIFALTLP
jgi:hypothetical protein